LAFSSLKVVRFFSVPRGKDLDLMPEAYELILIILSFIQAGCFINLLKWKIFLKICEKLMLVKGRLKIDKQREKILYELHLENSATES
jgi:hypothetical protein